MDKFIFWAHFKQVADKLPDVQRLKFYDMLTDFVFHQKEPQEVWMAAILAAIQTDLVQKRGGARVGAGRPLKNQNNQNNQKNVFDKKEIQSLRKIQKKNTPLNPQKEYNNISPIIQSIITPKFQKPDLEEVKAYCQERNAQVDAEKFWNFYEAKGWKIGKNTMTDWKACVRTWEKTAIEKNKCADPWWEALKAREAKREALRKGAESALILKMASKRGENVFGGTGVFGAAEVSGEVVSGAGGGLGEDSGAGAENVFGGAGGVGSKCSGAGVSGAGVSDAVEMGAGGLSDEVVSGAVEMGAVVSDGVVPGEVETGAGEMGEMGEMVSSVGGLSGVEAVSGKAVPGEVSVRGECWNPESELGTMGVSGAVKVSDEMAVCRGKG